MNAVRKNKNLLIWSAWLILVVVTILGLIRYTHRAALPFEVKASARGPRIEGVVPEGSATLPPSWSIEDQQLFIDRVEGITVDHSWHIRLALAGYSTGDTVDVNIRPLVGSLSVEVSEQSLVLIRGWQVQDLIFLALIGLFSFGLAAFLLHERSRHPAALSLAASLGLIGTSIALDEWGAPLGAGMMQWLPGVLWSYTYAFISPCILHFASAFTPQSRFWRRFGWIRHTAWVLGALIGSGTAIGIILYVTRESRLGYELCRICQNVLWIMLLASVFLVGFSLIQVYRRSEDWDTRNRVRWVLLGLVLGCVPPLLLIYLPRLLQREPPVPEPLALAFLLLLTVCLAIAVIRHQLLDISVVVRQGLMYAPATLGVYFIFAAVFVLAGFLLFRFMMPDLRQNLGILVILAFFALVFHMLYEPLRRRVQRVVDRLFFRTKYGFGKTVRMFSEGLEKKLAGVAVLTFLQQTILRTVNPAWVQIVERNGDWAKYWDNVQEAESDREPQLRLPFPELDGLELWIGQKRSGMAFHIYDRALLEAMVGLASNSLQRELLQRRLLEEAAEKERLEVLNRVKDDFLSLVSHDLRSPLSAITTSAAVMARRSSELQDEKSCTDAQRIQRNAQRLGHMVERLLHAARVGAGVLEPELKLCSLRDIADTVFDRHQLLADNAGVALDNSVPDDVEVVTDPMLIQEAVSNLVDNALKVSDRGMSVIVSARKIADDWMLTVTDYGPGIPESYLPDLFERGKVPAEAVKGVGFGLGLYLVRELVHLTGGSLELLETSSVGTTFSILMPGRLDDEKNSDS